MSTDDKLNVLKDMIALIGEAVLEGDQRDQMRALVTRFEKLAAEPKPARKRAPKAPAFTGPIPDVHAEFASRSKDEFLEWASSLDLLVLKHIVKTEQFDPAARSKNWRKSERFAELIHEQLRNRSGRGSAIGRAVGGS